LKAEPTAPIALAKTDEIKVFEAATQGHEFEEFAHFGLREQLLHAG
jgi:hypothetical protein